jgi:hypothetical protein
MLSENQKKAFIVGGFILVLASIGGVLVYKWRSASTPEQTVVEAPAAVPENEIVTVKKEGTAAFIFRRAGTTIATLPISPTMDSMVPLRQVGKLAYFKTTQTGGGGYVLFESASAVVVQVDSQSGVITMLKHEGRRLEDISPNGQFIAWSEYLDNGDKNIIVENTLAHSEQVFPVKREYSQFGDAHFSPDSTKLAYAAAIGFPGKENGAAYIITLKDKNVRVAANTSQRNTFYRIRGGRNGLRQRHPKER